MHPSQNANSQLPEGTKAMPSQVYTCLGGQDPVKSVGRGRIAIPGNSESSPSFLQTGGYP